MIRHSSSFFFSLILHTLLAIALLYAYKNVVKPEKAEEEKVEMRLCCMVEKVPKQKPKPIQKPKEIKKLIPKVIEKPKAKPIVKKTVIPKKVVIVKDMPTIKEEILEVKIIEEIIEPVEIQEEIQITDEEKQYAKIKRLEAQYMDKHIKEIVSLLRENLYYPRSARKRGIVGEVIVKFKLSVEAKSHSIEVISSNSEILSRAAIKTIEDLSGEFPKPIEELILHVPINYKLN